MAEALHHVHDPQPPPAETREETPVRAAPVATHPEEPASVEPTPVPAAPRRRRGGPLLVVGLVALLVVGIGALLLFDDDPAETPVAGDDTSDATSSPDESSAATPGEPESSATTEPEATETAPSGGGSRTAFVEDYYSVLPEDTESGYAMLAPSYQDDTSYSSYEGFWSTVDEVSIQDTATAGPNAVDVTLLYNGDDEEVRRIYLERGDDGWLITGDEIVG